MAHVYSPDPIFSGTCAGIEFNGGVAECSDPFVLGWLSAHGFGVGYEDQSTDSDNNTYIFPLSEPLEQHKEDALLAFARSTGIPTGGINSKNALIDRIRTHIKGGDSI